MNPRAHTDFLTAKSSFATGMGSCLNIAGNYYMYNISPTTAEADGRAISSDWEMIGNDLLSAIHETPLSLVNKTSDEK